MAARKIKSALISVFHKDGLDENDAITTTEPIYLESQ